MPIHGYVFDVYGTLLDTTSTEEAYRALLPDPAPLVHLWRTKQLEYAWLRSLMGAYVDFRQVTAEALTYAAGHFGMTLDEASLQSMVEAYHRLEPYADVRDGLARLGDRPLAVLSNGSPEMLDQGLTYAGLLPYFRWVISADAVRVYKPSPRVYVLGPERMGVNAEELLFVSANPFDVIGAKAFGYQVAWCNRAGLALDPLGREPDLEIRSLLDLPLG